MILIDLNAIKEWIENWLVMNKHYHPYSKTNNIPIPELYDILERIPTIDAVEVVRCKDCEWFKTSYMWNGKECKVCGIEPYAPVRGLDDFCSRGERREDE